MFAWGGPGWHGEALSHSQCGLPELCFRRWEPEGGVGLRLVRSLVFKAGPPGSEGVPALLPSSPVALGKLLHWACLFPYLQNGVKVYTVEASFFL